MRSKEEVRVTDLEKTSCELPLANSMNGSASQLVAIYLLRFEWVDGSLG